MKTKLKSLSKRSISVFLVLLMVVSTVTVGIFTTTAAFTEPDNESVGARVEADEAVGASGYGFKGSWDDWAEHASGTTLTLSAGSYTFVCYNGNTTYRENTTINANVSGTVTRNMSQGSSDATLSVATSGSYTITVSYQSATAVEFKIVGNGGSGSTTYYIVGDTALGAGGWDFDDTLTETSSGSGVYTYQMTWDDRNTGTYNFRVKDTGSWTGNDYGYTNINSTTGNDSNVYATLTQGSDNNINVKINSSCIVTLTFTASTSKIDLSFAPDIVPFDGYYLAGRIAVDNGSGTVIYPDSTANGYKWDSTNIKFTETAKTNIYKYETKKTVRQLAQYIGTSNDKEQNFVIYDRNHNWGDGSASLDFYDFRGDLNAVSSTAYAVSNNNTNEMSFNHSAHMYDDSDGKVIIWLDATGVTDKTAGTGTLKIYYTLDGETRAIADSVNLTASPSPQRYDKNMTLTASLVDANVPANSTCTYSFYDGTTLIDTVTSTTGAASYRITAPGSPALGVHNYNVVVSTAVTYTDGTGSHTYHNVTARADGEFIAPATYVSADLTSGVTPGYTASNWTRVTDNETAYLVSAANNKSTYTFALSSEMAYDTTFTEFSVDSSRTEYVDITLSHADVTINGEIATVRTYTFAPRVNCSGMRVYLDTATGKVYATANYNGTGTRTNTFSETETVRYYFAESRYYDSNSSGDSLDSIKNGIKIYYWNSSVADKNGYAYGTAVNINGAKCTAGSTDHRVYMDQSAFVVHNMKESSASVPGGTKNLECNIYYCDLPIWATCFRFVNSSDTGITSRWEVLNPNRVYCMFEYGTNKYVSSAVLDETLWSPNEASGTKNQNMTSDVLRVKTNLIKYKRTNSQGAYSGYANDNDAVDANAALSTKYNTNSTAYPLYFGNYAAFTQSVFTAGMPGQLYTGSTGFNMRWNLAQRGAPTGKDTDDLKYDGGCAYYASIWNLTGFLLDKSETNDIGGYYLTNPNNSNRMPLFDYSNLSDAATVYSDKRFPFYKSSYNGITTYSYDSLADPNRLYSSSDYTIEDTVSSTYFRKVGNLPGYQPSDQNASFANEFDINFYMTSTGAMTPKNKINGEDQDIAFNFSGDDDVWVYVDGVKVLDLGGDHMISAGSINFTKMKVYYKTAAETAATVASNDTIGYKTGFPNGYEGLGGSWAYSSDNVYTVNLQHLFDAAGVTFKNTDATSKHKLQMFYVERGQNESNLSLEFNLPQASGLSVKNSVTTGNVNPGLVNAAKGAASGDYFVYTVKDRLSTETDVNNTKAHGGIWSNVRSAASSVTGLSFSLPLFPANTNAVRDVEGIRYTLAKSGSSGSAASGYTAPTSTTSFTDVKNVNYYLSDENLTGKATDLSGQVGSNGELYLLSGQMANFRNSIGANTSLAVRQHVNLGVVQEESNGIAQYSAVEKNDAGNYYITSYSITDDTTNTELQSRTGDKFLSGTGDSLLALDTNTDNNDSFYFSSYSADEDKNSPAMTVTYYNDVAVGDIKIQKAYDKTYADMSTNFRFTVEFANIFGDDENFSSLQEYDGLVYYVYDSNNNLVYETPKIYSPDSGIIIQAGQYALIKGVPVETRFKVTERTAANHELVSISKTARKSDGITPLNTVSGLAINSSTFYDESIDKNSTDTTGASPYDSWNGATAFSNKSTSDGYKDATTSDDMIYYVNMIPNIAESKTGSDTSAYQSVSKIIFTNEKQKFSVVFKYYDRARINDEPAQINILPVTYTVNFDGLTEFTNLFTTETTVGTRTYQEGDFKSYDFKRLIQTAAVEFASDTNISNILDEYHMWKGQTEAVTALTTGSLRNVKENKDYSQEDVLYHTNYIGEVQTASEASNERWVTYKNDKGVPLTDPYGFNMSGVTEEAYADGDVISYDAISSIVVWCYNQPKQYSVTVHKTTASDALSAKSVTLNGTSKTVYMSNNANTAVFNAYYNQRLGYEREYNDAGFFEQYGIEGYTNDLPNAQIAEEISSGGNTYKFAYWAFDALGTQVASTEIKYYYRVTNTVNLYPVYLPSSDALDVYGLSVLQDQQDTFVNSSGVSKTRLNLIFNPYGLHDYDSNILDSAVLNIIIQDDQWSQFGDDDAIRTMFNNNKNGLQTYLNDHAQAIMTTDYTGTSPNLTYVMRGFEYTMKGNADDNGLSTNVVIQLTNKNRMQFTSIFNTATLYKTDQTQKVLQVTAMKYGDTWVISDNCVIDTFIGPVSTP